MSRRASARRPPRGARRAALIVALAAAAVLAGAFGGCGGDDDAQPAATPDDAYVVRASRQQQIGLALARVGARRPATRALARTMVRQRERTLGLLSEPLGRVADTGATADLGVTEQQAAEDLTPDALRSARPFENAFLLVMLRHEEGTLALAQAQLRRGRDAEVKALAERIGVETAREMTRVRARLATIAQQAP